jgi:hypothetical protein
VRPLLSHQEDGGAGGQGAEGEDNAEAGQHVENDALTLSRRAAGWQRVVDDAQAAGAPQQQAVHGAVGGALGGGQDVIGCRARRKRHAKAAPRFRGAVHEHSAAWGARPLLAAVLVALGGGQQEGVQRGSSGGAGRRASQGRAVSD